MAELLEITGGISQAFLCSGLLYACYAKGEQWVEGIDAWIYWHFRKPAVFYPPKNVFERAIYYKSIKNIKRSDYHEGHLMEMEGDNYFIPFETSRYHDKGGYRAEHYLKIPSKYREEILTQIKQRN